MKLNSNNAYYHLNNGQSSTSQRGRLGTQRSASDAPGVAPSTGFLGVKDSLAGGKVTDLLQYELGTQKAAGMVPVDALRQANPGLAESSKT